MNKELGEEELLQEIQDPHAFFTLCDSDIANCR